MQLEYMLLMIIMLIIIPIVAICSNDTAFYIITSIIVVISSLKSFYNNFFGITVKSEMDEEDKKLIEEIENQINLDLYKLGKGFQMIKVLVIMLFYIYCAFYLHEFWLKALSIFMIVHWINILVNNLNTSIDDSSEEKKSSLLKRMYMIFVNISAIIIITFSAYSKFIKH